jgi:inosine-uridine nucleoside N-ribohydrolase
MRLFAAFILCSAVLHAEPVKLIFDTDMGNDVDDVMALTMIHSLQSRGACELVAVTLTKDHPLAAPFVDAINTFYGRPDIPIGVVRNGATREEGKFNKLAIEKNADGTLRYPHDLLDGADAPEAVKLLRKTLAAQPDQSVVIAQVGFFTNLSRLLDSGGDEFSPLSGIDLVVRKVRFISIMAGAFQTVDWNTRFLEYNVTNDIPAARKIAGKWPTPIVWSGFEIGTAARFPHQVVVEDFNYVKHHPLKEAYHLYDPPPHDRPTWDPTSVLHAVCPERGYFGLSPQGRVEVEENGATWFRPDGNGRDRFLTMNAEQAARVREAIVQLCVQPPPTLLHKE